MQTFDCLAEETTLLGPHFLEASAGTGKTFALEHIVARLLLQEEVSFEIENILIVTFTKAATRELRLRIRSNLEKIEQSLTQGEVLFPYLNSYLGSAKAIRKIGDALALFDRAQIFTIHSFCYKMLKEFGFEAGIGFSAKEREESDALDLALSDFFESKLTIELISPEQLGILLKEYGSMESLVRQMKKNAVEMPYKTFSERVEEFKKSLNLWTQPLDQALLQEDFESLRTCFKAEVKGRFIEQIQALFNSFAHPVDGFRQLIAEKGTLFLFLSPKNQKQKAKFPSRLHYPGFFDWAIEHLFPLIQEAASPEECMNTVRAYWRPIASRIAAKEESFGPDEILDKMEQAVLIESFKKAIQTKYRAALIDEFQDTDPKQWDIFRNLFLHSADSLFLVGDPKQSIYRFRSADLYTYLKAKESFLQNQQYYLDTNFRSSKSLVETLNRLFDREWLVLPKEGRTLPFHPVRAGSVIQTDFSDGKGAVHCIRYPGLSPESLYAYLIREIIALKEKMGRLSGFAVLVKDRYMAHSVQEVLAAAGIASITKSRQPLSESLAFEATEELFDALADPKHLGKAKTVLGGPFGGVAAEDLKIVDFSPFVSLRERLDREGLPSFMRFFWDFALGERSVREEVGSRGAGFYSECQQVLERLFEWEKEEGFSLEGAFRFMLKLKQMDPDETPIVAPELDEDAVQIMTMHVSKGLEFDVVFALGLSARTPSSDLEGDAEKLRQLYVATTRAKKRLYIPLPIYPKEAVIGTRSPIELFCEALGKTGKWEDELEILTQESSLTVETIEESAQSQIQIEKSIPDLICPSETLIRMAPSHLLSFTAISQERSHPFLKALDTSNQSFTAHNLPRGAETGIAIHTIFERVFTTNGFKLETIVEDVISGSTIAPWKDVIIEMVQKTLELELPCGVRCLDLNRSRILVETEFFFQNGDDSYKGIIDLIFEHEKQLYIVDWKTNWLGEDISYYTEENGKKAIEHHQYDLQAKLYAESLRRVTDDPLGGVLFLFVRGYLPVWLKEVEWKMS